MINLQKEFIDFVDNGNFDHVIVRHLTNTRCFCIRKENGAADPDCVNCDGEGWRFEEFLIKCKYFYTPKQSAHSQDTNYAITYSNLLFIYISATELNDNNISTHDIIFQVKTNLDGSIIDPIIREAKWRITDVNDLNMMGGQREFLKVFAKPMTV